MYVLWVFYARMCADCQFYIHSYTQWECVLQFETPTSPLQRAYFYTSLFCVWQLAKESEATTRQLQSELIEAQSNAKKLSNEVHAATECIQTLLAEEEVTLVQIIE